MAATIIHAQVTSPSSPGIATSGVAVYRARRSCFGELQVHGSQVVSADLVVGLGLDPEPSLFIDPFLSNSCVSNLFDFNKNHSWYIALQFWFKVSGLTLNGLGDKGS
jgi:hypothetical protein